MSPRRTTLEITRRRWTVWLAAMLPAFPAVAQVTSKAPPQGAPAPGSPAATPEQKTQKAYSDVRKVSDALTQLEVPMNVEPAFTFRA